MRRILVLFVFLWYKVYGEGEDYPRLAYERAIIVMSLVFLMNFLTLLEGFGYMDILPKEDPDPRWLAGLKYALFVFIPFNILMRIAFKKEEIIEAEFDEATIKKGSLALMIYTVGSFVLLAGTILYKEGI